MVQAEDGIFSRLHDPVNKERSCEQKSMILACVALSVILLLIPEDDLVTCLQKSKLGNKTQGSAEIWVEDKPFFALDLQFRLKVEQTMGESVDKCTAASGCRSFVRAFRRVFALHEAQMQRQATHRVKNIDELLAGEVA